MPIRRLNYTGRQRLLREDTRITLIEKPGEIPSFDAVLDLQPYELPEAALVSVEAYRQTSWMRFDFGTVGNLTPPPQRQLAQFVSTDGVLFRVRVTASTDRHGLLLAEGDRIPLRRPEDQEDKRIPLLDLVSADLGEEVARVDFSDRPILEVNRLVGDVRNLAHLPAFAALVYPMALRTVLTRILRVEKYDGGIEDETDWRSRWLRFAALLPGAGAPPADLIDEVTVDDWIDEAVAAYGRQHHMMSRFGEFLSREGNT